MTPAAEVLRPEVVKALGLKEREVYLGFSTEYPDCMRLVVLRDVGEDQMNKVLRIIRKHVKAGAKLRLCANVVQRKFATKFKGLDFDAAWKLSWNVNIATVRT
jgi:hypothetical protein